MNVAQIHLWSEPLPLGAYTVTVAAAALAVPWVAATLAVMRCLPLGRVAFCLSMSAVAMLAGSRLLHWWTHPAVYQQDPWRLVSFSFRDFSLFGGLLLAGLTGAICCWVTRLDLWRLADCVAPALGMGIALTRLGCFLNGCCFGVETHLPWGVVYPSGSPCHLHQIGADFLVMFSGSQSVHPTQIYEMAAAAGAGLLALVLLRRNLPSGVPFLVAAIVFSGFRWINDSLRVHAATLVTAGWSYRNLYAVLVVIGTAVLFWRLRANSDLVHQCR